MIVDDPPSLRLLFEQQRKQTVQRLFARDQLPAAAHKSAVKTQYVDLKVAEAQRAHLLWSFCLILMAITIECSFPSRSNLVAGEKGQVRGLPVTDHESIKIAPVPGIDL